MPEKETWVMPEPDDLHDLPYRVHREADQPPPDYEMFHDPPNPPYVVGCLVASAIWVLGFLCGMAGYFTVWG